MKSLSSATDRLVRRCVRWHSRLVVPEERERGDVPGWVMITLMTAVLVVVIWGIASDQLQKLLTSAFDKISNQSSTNP
ncbi:MAG: hypothetical protein K6T28_00260 [Acidothermus sp.]|nr:hypothetical protein [Acidothermus sp.]